jgi:hypothetical protein
MIALSTAVTLFVSLAAEGEDRGGVVPEADDARATVIASPDPQDLRPQWQQRWRGDEIVELERPKWIKHTVVPRENLRDVAVRYGVQLDSLQSWNHLSGTRVKRGKKLRVKTSRLVPEREKIEYVVREGDTWGSIAADFRVDTKDLHGFNYRVKELEPGQTLLMWFDPAVPWTVGRGIGPLPNRRLVRADSRSKGTPQKGRIENGVALPDSADYTRRSERMMYGSSNTIRAMQAAFASFRYETGYEGEIIIGSISLKRGGRFRPHKSHQSGRDADIRLPLLPSVPDWREPAPEEIDWLAAFELVEALIETGEVETIFLVSELQRNLYEAGRALGRTHEQLATIVTYPREPGKPAAVVKHSKGHDQHIHVRFACGDDEPKCKGH